MAAMLAVGGVACDDDDPVGEPGAGDFLVRIENVGTAFDFVKSGTFDTGIGAESPGAIGPGGAYEISFTAPEGAKLTLVTMFVPSNDFFYAPDGDGIDLYDEAGAPRSGDVTSEISLWDAGTEINQEPGAGPDQVQRQSGPDTGADDPDANVRPAPDDFDNLPAVDDVIQVTLTPSGTNQFTVRIDNVSDGTTLMSSNGAHPVPLSPGAWVIHRDADPLFTVGSPLPGEGLEAIAEDGANSDLDASITERTGVTVPLSPGAWAVHTAPAPIFENGTPDRGDGLEAIAEDGMPETLATSLADQSAVASSGVFDTPVGASEARAAGPGEAYEFTITAQEGDALSFATMFVPSNDLFYSPNVSGIPLFVNGNPITGDRTGAVGLWDAGTEVNQEPGIGPDQVQRQGGLDTGPDEGGNVVSVSVVDDGFVYPAVSDVLRVTITPVS